MFFMCVIYNWEGKQEKSWSLQFWVFEVNIDMCPRCKLLCDIIVRNCSHDSAPGCMVILFAFRIVPNFIFPPKLITCGISGRHITYEIFLGR